MEKQKKRYKQILMMLMVVISISHILPFYILITTSLKRANDFSSKWAIPDYVFFENFTQAWERANLGQAFINNILITVISMLLLVGLGSMAAYPLARFKTKLNKSMYMVFVAAMIVPPLAVLVPLYEFIVNIGGLNTLWAVILINVTFYLPITIFLYTGFISSTIPRELEEAAMIDGATRVGIFFRVVFPLLKPVTASVIIISSVFIWNDYQFAVFFLQDSGVQNITVSLSTFFSQYSNNVGLVAAGSLLALLPMVIVFLFLQKQFIEGLASGSVKG